MRKFNLIYFIFIVFILLAIVYLYFSVNDFDKKAEENIKKVILTNTSYFIENIESDIRKNVAGDLYTALKENPQLRKKLEEQMESVVTPSFKYIYMLYRDSDGRYRYLLDGSKEEKGHFDEKFDVNQKEWDSVYKTKEMKILYQNDISGLWITTLKPYIKNNEVQGVIAIDFSTTLLDFISDITRPLKDIFMYIFVSIIFLFAVIVYQIFIQMRVRKDSIIDPLTHTYNRVFLRDFAAKIDFYNYDVAMFDLDHFKKINDNYGHKAGDYVLETFCSIVKKNIRNKDVLVRFGGEEFLLFLYKKRKENLDSKRILERIRKAIEAYRFKYENFDIRVTVSVGFVAEMQKYRTIQEIIKKADERLYKAKHSGRNQIVDYDTLENSHTQTENFSISYIKQAIDNNRVLCHYQPIVALKTEKIVKHEALIRLLDENGNLIFPGAFLDLIENTNIYRDMTKKLLEIVFEKINEVNSAISINLNLSDIIDNSIYEILIEEIKNNKHIAKYLTIELLEYEAIDNALLKERLQEIKSYGILIALDDFGSGYSNFSIFEALPIDILKIDGSLIKNLDTSEVSLKIVESIVLLAKGLQLKIIAEFIHSDEILKIVKDANIEHGQGFYLGKPLESL